MAEDAAESGSRKDPHKIKKPPGTATTVGFFHFGKNAGREGGDPEHLYHRLARGFTITDGIWRMTFPSRRHPPFAWFGCDLSIVGSSGFTLKPGRPHCL